MYILVQPYSPSGVECVMSQQTINPNISNQGTQRSRPYIKGFYCRGLDYELGVACSVVGMMVQQARVVAVVVMQHVLHNLGLVSAGNRVTDQSSCIDRPGAETNSQLPKPTTFIDPSLPSGEMIQFQVDRFSPFSGSSSTTPVKLSRSFLCSSAVASAVPELSTPRHAYTALA